MKIENKRLVYALLFPCLFVILLWLIYFSEQGLDADWHTWGIYPRKLYGLKGILTEPLLHSGIGHLFSNSVPLIILGWCLSFFYKDLSLFVFPAVWILSGFFTWCIGRESWHIGASGLVYALSFFLFFSGIFRRYIPLLAISLLVVFLYGNSLWNMLPIAEVVDPSISWEGHLSGAISGLVAAVLFRKEGPQKPIETDEEEEGDDEIDEENSILN